VVEIFKAYLIHFIYIIIIIVDGLIHGENDINTLVFILSLAFVYSIGVFIFNFGITAAIVILVENDKYNIMAFLTPSILMVLLFKPMSNFLRNLSFGPDGLYWIILFVSSIINVLSYFFIKRGKKA